MVLSLAVPSAQTRPASGVTAERLRQPPPGEWLTYGLDHAETRFSPLTGITVDNVKQLQSAWTWDIPGGPGQIEATPLVHDGVLYASGTWSVIFALDARTGALKWKWDPGSFAAAAPVAARPSSTARRIAASPSTTARSTPVSRTAGWSPSTPPRATSCGCG